MPRGQRVRARGGSYHLPTSTGTPLSSLALTGPLPKLCPIVPLFS